MCPVWKFSKRKWPKFIGKCMLCVKRQLYHVRTWWDLQEMSEFWDRMWRSPKFLLQININTIKNSSPHLTLEVPKPLHLNVGYCFGQCLTYAYLKLIPKQLGDLIKYYQVYNNLQLIHCVDYRKKNYLSKFSTFERHSMCSWTSWSFRGIWYPAKVKKQITNALFSLHSQNAGDVHLKDQRFLS